VQQPHNGSFISISQQPPRCSNRQVAVFLNISPAAKWQQPPSGSFYLNNSTAAQVRQPPSGSFPNTRLIWQNQVQQSSRATSTLRLPTRYGNS